MNFDLSQLIKEPSIKVPKKHKSRWTIQEIYLINVEPHLNKIHHWRLMGHSLKEIASYLGISEEALKQCTKKNPNLDAILKASNRDLIIMMEQVIIKNALEKKNVESALVILSKISDKWNNDFKKDGEDRVVIINDLDTEELLEMKKKDYNLTDDELKDLVKEVDQDA